MKSNVWLRFIWTDYQLQWDEADYGGIGVLRLPPDKVWKPDIVLFNKYVVSASILDVNTSVSIEQQFRLRPFKFCSADGNYEVRYKSNVLIYPNGDVLWVPPAIYQSSCTIDVTYFPFDQQTCIMKFGSWTFNGDQVSLALYNNKNFVDLSDYWKSGTWDIISVPAYLNTYKGDFPTETDITFYIIIRRKTLFYTVNLILPTVLISFLCVLVFYLPAEAGEKVTLGISILLSLVVFLLLVSKILPPTSLVLPLIAKYLLFTFIMNTVSILVTVIIINWNFRGPRTHRMPQLIRKIFLKYLPTILLMRRPKKTRLRWMMEIPNVTLPTSTYSGSPTELPKHLPASLTKSKMEVMELSDLHHPNCKINRKVHHTTSSSSAAGGEGLADRRGSESSDSVLLSPEASKATEAVEFIAEHLRNEDLYIQVSATARVEQFHEQFLIVDACSHSHVCVSDARGLEVRGDGDRSTAALHFLPRDVRRHHRDPHGRTSHLRVRGPGSYHRDLPWKVIPDKKCLPDQTACRRCCHNFRFTSASLSLSLSLRAFDFSLLILYVYYYVWSNRPPHRDKN